MIAIIVELFFVFEENTCGSPKTSIWNKIKVFFELLPLFLLFSFIGALCLTLAPALLKSFFGTHFGY